MRTSVRLAIGAVIGAASAMLVVWMVTAARADPIDMTAIMQGPDGPFTECRKMDDARQRCLEQTPITLGRLCVTAAALPDKNASLVDQTAHGALAIRLLKAGNAEQLTAEEIAFLKAQIAKLDFNTMLVAQAVMLLDPVKK